MTHEAGRGYSCSFPSSGVGALPFLAFLGLDLRAAGETPMRYRHPSRQTKADRSFFPPNGFFGMSVNLGDTFGRAQES